ncbi:hypothetical protein DXG03_007962, partial [Asterophora parasitica]
MPGTGVVKQHPKEDEARIRGEDGQERGVGEMRDMVGEQKGKAVGGARDEVAGRTGVDLGDRDQVRDVAGQQAQAGRNGYMDDSDSSSGP